MSGDAPTTSMTLPSEENAAAPGAVLRRAMQFLSTYGTIIGMGLMIVIFSVAAPRAFPTYGNFLNVLNQASLVAIIAGGLTVTVIVGELDLSIGFAASWAGVLVTGLMVHGGMPPWLAILAVLASGAVIALGAWPLAYSGGRRTSTSCSSGFDSRRSCNSATLICGILAISNPRACHASTPPAR